MKQEREHENTHDDDQEDAGGGDWTIPIIDSNLEAELGCWAEECVEGEVWCVRPVEVDHRMNNQEVSRLASQHNSF